MRVADYIWKTLADKGIRHVSLVTGGGAMYLNDALGLEKRIRYVENDQYSAWAYQYVHDILQDPVTRAEAEAKMGITVSGFRDLLRSHAEAVRRVSRWVRFRDRWLLFRRSKGAEFGRYSL